ncbi:histone-lysine N-methyltransferase 2D-like [Brienomyrus brachyistius]|uniref:histone-lysine N-methyltransferase 2D-like n=1 Tax=Brienomyrus brachyistius TaxID=42636 RepID=UPI0020B3AECD|nr:histone-lysine N-methyltransferase 2D-like [Brienomyrus brachyistius]
MAFSSRFSFWEQKVKDETKPGLKNSKENQSNSDSSMSSRSQSVPSLNPARALLRAKSPEPQQEQRKSPELPRGRPSFRSTESPGAPGRFKSPEPPILNGDSGSKGPEEQSVGPRKVIRRMVQKAQPSEEDESATKPATVTPKPGAVPKVIAKPFFNFKHDTIKKEEKDDITAGLTNLMGRGRSRDPRPRSRIMHVEEKLDDQKQPEGKVEESSASLLAQKDESQLSSPTEALPPSQTSPNTPPVGFIPAPKSSQVLSSPAGLNPKPSPPNPPAKANTFSPPVGFIPPPKTNPLTPPGGFVPPPKVNTLPSPAGFVPAAKASPLSPPPGFIPALKPSSLRKPEVVQLTPTEEAQRRLERIFNVPVIL